MLNGEPNLTYRLIFLLGGFFSPTTYFHLIRWSPPPRTVKLKFDGSLSNSSIVGGFVIWDWIGRLIKVEASHYGYYSILVAEARAMRAGVRIMVH